KVPDAVMVEIPKLVEMATEQVEVASVPFASFIANKNQSGDPASYSFVLRGYVRHWLDKVWAEYDRTGLLDILGARQAPRAPAGPKTTANGGRGGKPSRPRKPATISSSAGARNMRPTSR